MIQLAIRYNISIVVDIARQYYFYFLQENRKWDKASRGIEHEYLLAQIDTGFFAI